MLGMSIPEVIPPGFPAIRVFNDNDLNWVRLACEELNTDMRL